MNIENKKQLAIFLFAVALGVIAAVLTGQYIQTTIEEAEKRQLKEIEKQTIKPMRDEMAAMKQQMAALAARPIPAAGGGAAVAPGGAPATSTLSILIPAGKRAYTIRIDPLSAVGGMVNPGDIIDIISRMDIPDPITNKVEKVTTMVFQNVKVLAVNTNLQATGGYEQQSALAWLNVTLALTPEEAGLMTFLKENGKLQVVLRAPSETQIETLQKADWQNLAEYVYNKQGTEIATPMSQNAIKPGDQKKEEAKPYIEIYKGGQQQ